MPFISKIDEVKDTKTPQQTRQEHKEDQAIKNFLYGAGKNGWTKEAYQKRLDAFNNNCLAYTVPDPSDITLLLAENKREEDLTDDERVLLAVGCYPVVKIKKTEEQLKAELVVTAYKWHQLTDFRHIDEVYVYHPEIYKRWVEKNMIPLNKLVDAPPILKEYSNNEKNKESDEEFLQRLRREVPEDSPLRKPHEDWFKDYK